ncbi:MAG: hypothetical protein O3C10_01830 [Chloroflexi bacterium]|nr:hypothetical protein [Chloroflexota bacterium]
MTAPAVAVVSLALALAHYDAGLSVVPPKEDGSKAPSLTTWTQWQNQQRPREAVAAEYQQRRAGIGWLTGAASGTDAGPLEVLEFDDPPTYEAYKVRAVEWGLGELVERIEAGR